MICGEDNTTVSYAALQYIVPCIVYIIPFIIPVFALLLLPYSNRYISGYYNVSFSLFCINTNYNKYYTGKMSQHSGAKTKINNKRIKEFQVLEDK